MQDYSKIIKKRGKYYYLDFSHKGTRIRKSTGKDTFQEAIKVYEDFITSLNNQGEIKEEYTFDYVAVKFLESKKVVCRERTYKDYVNYFKIFYRFFSTKLIKSINKELLTSYYEYRKINKARDEKVKKEFTILNIFFNFALSYEYIDKNPLNNFLLKNNLKTYKPKEDFLNPNQIQQLLNNCNEYLKRLIIFLLETGLRVNEALNLTCYDVCYDELEKINYIVVREELSKNKKPRFVPLTNLAQEQINKQKLEFPLSHYVFTNSKGQGYTTTPRKALLNACKKAGINGIGFHIFRHTFASFKLQGLNIYGERIQPLRIEIISKLLGHSSIDITDKVYAKFCQQDILKSLK